MIGAHPPYKPRPYDELLELQAAVGARALDERLRASAGRTRVAVEVDLGRAFAFEHRAPVTAHDLGHSRDLVLLDQEVRARASTFARTRRATDEHGNAGREAAVAQLLHVRDGSRHHGDERHIGEQLFGFVGRKRIHESGREPGSKDTQELHVGCGRAATQGDRQTCEQRIREVLALPLLFTCCTVNQLLPERNQ